MVVTCAGEGKEMNGLRPMNLINQKGKEIPLTPAGARREREKQPESREIGLAWATSAVGVHGFKARNDLWRKSFHEPGARFTEDGLLSPALSSKAGEGEDHCAGPVHGFCRLRFEHWFIEFIYS
jgi:hypothetical protein